MVQISRETQCADGSSSSASSKRPVIGFPNRGVSKIMKHSFLSPVAPSSINTTLLTPSTPMNTPTQKQSKAELKQSKVELLLAAENVRQALNDYEFADLAQTLGNGMTETQIKNILLTAAMARTTVDYTPGVLEFNPAEQQKLQQKASSHTQRTENGSETGSGSVMTAIPESSSTQPSSRPLPRPKSSRTPRPPRSSPARAAP
ncbi:hypothetical protein C8R43DRAFT_208162 [Mycena crocata]|nr:hypothetical protein C8R43DRAFT_208162 [Mycena crocata]